MFYGQYIGAGEETTWATAVARTKFAPVFAGAVLAHRRPARPRSELNRRDVTGHFYDAEFGDGSFAFPLSYDGGFLMKILKHTLGIAGVSGAGPYVHTYTVNDGPPYTGGSVATAHGLTLELHADLPDAGPLESWRMDGAAIQSLALSFQQNQELQGVVTPLGQKVTQVVKTAQATVDAAMDDLDTYAVIPSQITLTVDGTSYSAVCDRVDLTINPNLAQIPRLGSVYIRQPRPAAGKRTVTGTLLLDWEATPSAKTLYDKFLSGATAIVVVTATGPSGRSLVATMSKVRILGDTPPVQEGGVLPVSLPFIAEYNATDSGPIKVVLTNQIATT